MSEIDDPKAEIAVLQKMLDDNLGFETQHDPGDVVDVTPRRRAEIEAKIRRLRERLATRER